MKAKRTIIMLSAKRCGSTAIFRMFQKHPAVGVCHVNQDIDNWEPNFWNLAADAIFGNSSPFIERFKKSHPFLLIPSEFTEASVFKLWDDILEESKYPALFDKSPQYLGNHRALNLLLKYKHLGNDVRLFAIIRDPRDAVTSQYELWHSTSREKSIQEREQRWLKKYSHLEELKGSFGYIPLFRYEDFSQAPNIYATLLYEFCELEPLIHTYSHIKPTSIGRYSASVNRRIRTWRMTEEFQNHILKYGYRIPQMSIADRMVLFFKMIPGNMRREIAILGRKILGIC